MKKDLKSALKRATKVAENLARNGEAANDLLEKAYQKMGKNENALGGAKGDFLALLRMVRASVLGSYNDVPWKSIISALTAILYFVNPLDVIPDFFVGSGFLDDLTVFGLVLNVIRSDLDAFRAWENAKTKKD